MTASTPAVGKRRRWLQILGFVCIFLVLGLGVLIAFAPAIASSMAPGIVQSAARERIKGDVAVGSASLSWFGPMKFTQIELRDPAGKSVAVVNAEATVGLWSLLGGSMNLGTITLSGKADLVRYPDGTTNLDAATAPKAAPAKAPAPAAQPLALPSGLNAKVIVSGIDFSYRENDAAGSPLTSTSLQGVRGEATVTAGAAPKAAIEFTGGVAGGAGAAGDASSTGSLKISIKLDNFADAQGRLTPEAARVDATIESGTLPVPLLDALARQGGLLSGALGPTASLSVVAKGGMAAGDAQLQLRSPNASADLDLALKDGAIAARKPGTIALRSTAFLDKHPALKEQLARAGVAISQWPSVDLQVNALSLPLPAQGAQSPAGQPDLRGVALDVQARTAYFSGTLRPASPAPSSEPAGAATVPADATAPRAVQSFGIQPATLSIQSTDLAAGVKLVAATSAMLDKQSAGAINITIEAGGLLDDQGRLALVNGLPRTLSGSFTASGVSSSLISPFLGPESPVNPLEDLGSTVDVVSNFRSAAPAGAGGAGAAAVPAGATASLPPLDIDASITSQNVRIEAPLRVSAGVLSSRGDVTVGVKAAAPLVRRVLASRAADAPPLGRIAGDAEVRIAVSDLAMPLPTGGAPMNLSAIAGAIRAQVQRFDFTPAGVSAAGGALGVRDIVVDVRLAPGKPTAITMAGGLAHAERPFTLDSRLEISGLESALAPKAPPTAIVPGLGPMRIDGTLTFTDVPASLADLAPVASKPAAPARLGTSAPGAAPAVDAAGLVRELLNGIVGERATIALTFDPGATPADGQKIGAAITGAGLSARLDAALTPAALRVDALTAEATVRPETVRGLLKAAGQDQGNLAGVTTRGPAKLAIRLDPVSIPLAAPAGGAPGFPKPDFARAGVANLNASIAEPLVVSGIPFGESAMTGGVREFRATAAVPLGMLAGPGAGDPLRATIRGTLLLDENRPIGALAVDATAPRDLSAVDATAMISGLNTLAVDGVLNQPGLVSGALGETADISISMRQELARPGPDGAVAAASTPKPLRAKVQVSKSPRLSTDSLDVVIDESRIALLAPAKATWTLDPAWADKFILAPAPGKTQTFRLVGPTPLAVDIQTFSIGRRTTSGGLVTSDYLRPGVFALSLIASASKVQIQPLEAGAAGAPVALENLTATVRTSDPPAQALTIDIRAASVSGGGVSSREPVTFEAVVRDFATGGGAFNREGYDADLTLRAPSVPTALVDAVAGTNGRLVDLLGTQVRAGLNARNFSPRQGSSGRFDLDIRAFRPPSTEPSGLVTLAAPVRDGLILTGQGGADARPFRAELAEFNVGERDRLVQTLGIIATMSKARTDAQGKPNPAVIQSANLSFPLDPNRGNLRRVSGDIDVSLGTVNYSLRTGFAGLIQSGMLKDLTRDVKQPSMKPFRVSIREGVASYQNVEIPLKVGLGLGEEIILIPVSGKVDLVDQTIDGVVDLPLSIVSGPVLSIFPIGFTDLRTKMLNALGNKDAASADQEQAKRAGGIRIPIRIRGPLDSPKFEPSLDLFGSRNSGTRPEDMLKNFGDTIKGIGEGFKDLFNRGK